MQTIETKLERAIQESILIRCMVEQVEEREAQGAPGSELDHAWHRIDLEVKQHERRTR